MIQLTTSGVRIARDDAWAALACQRGLLCLHASAVVCADGVHAFSIVCCAPWTPGRSAPRCRLATIPIGCSCHLPRALNAGRFIKRVEGGGNWAAM